MGFVLLVMFVGRNGSETVLNLLGIADRPRESLHVGAGSPSRVGSKAGPLQAVS